MENYSKCVILSINLSEKTFLANQKIRETIDDFTTAVNDIYIDRFRKQMCFDADFINPNTMVFTLDDPSYINETEKIVNKLLTNKKFKSIQKLVIQNEQMFI